MDDFLGEIKNIHKPSPKKLLTFGPASTYTPSSTFESIPCDII